MDTCLCDGIGKHRSGKWGDKVDEPDIPNMTTNDLLENNMNGYSETQVILNTYDDTQLKNTYKAFFKIKDYRTKIKYRMTKIYAVRGSCRV